MEVSNRSDRLNHWEKSVKMHDQEIEYGSIIPQEEPRLLNFYLQMLDTGAKVSQLYRWRKNGDPRCREVYPYVARIGGDIVGTVNVVPVKLTYKGRKIEASWQQDSVVSPTIRGKGVGKNLVNLAAQGWDMVIARGTTDAMYGLRRSMSFIDVPNSNFLIKPLAPFGDRRDFKRSLIFLILWFLSRLRGKEEIKTTLKSRKVHEFDKSFDDLAEKLGKSDEIMPYKDSAYLNRRYFKCPGKEYCVIRADDEQGMRGAIVLNLNKVPMGSAWIVDMITAPYDRECANELLNAAFRNLKDRDAGYVWAFATSSTARVCLFERGFINTRATPRFTYRLKRGDLDLTEAQWNFWHGDGDLELYD